MELRKLEQLWSACQEARAYTRAEVLIADHQPRSGIPVKVHLNGLSTGDALHDAELDGLSRQLVWRPVAYRLALQGDVEGLGFSTDQLPFPALEAFCID